MSSISFEQAMATLTSMFPTIDKEICTAVLYQQHGHLENTIDTLLSFQPSTTPPPSSQNPVTTPPLSSDTPNSPSNSPQSANTVLPSEPSKPLSDEEFAKKLYRDQIEQERKAKLLQEMKDAQIAAALQRQDFRMARPQYPPSRHNNQSRRRHPTTRHPTSNTNSGSDPPSMPENRSNRNTPTASHLFSRIKNPFKRTPRYSQIESSDENSLLHGDVNDESAQVSDFDDSNHPATMENNVLMTTFASSPQHDIVVPQIVSAQDPPPITASSPSKPSPMMGGTRYPPQSPNKNFQVNGQLIDLEASQPSYQKAQQSPSENYGYVPRSQPSSQPSFVPDALTTMRGRSSPKKGSSSPSIAPMISSESEAVKSPGPSHPILSPQPSSDASQTEQAIDPFYALAQGLEQELSNTSSYTESSSGLSENDSIIDPFDAIEANLFPPSS